jgi:hypothetical protein
MDWTMVSNAKDAIDRIKTILYLFRDRYQVDAQAGGRLLAGEQSDNLLCKQVIEELRAELNSPSTDLSVGGLTDADARKHFESVLRAYDETLGNRA